MEPTGGFLRHKGSICKGREWQSIRAGNGLRGLPARAGSPEALPCTTYNTSGRGKIFQNFGGRKNFLCWAPRNGQGVAKQNGGLLY